MQYIISEIITLSESQLSQINKIIINNSYIKCVGYKRKCLSDSLKDYVYKYPSAIYVKFNSGAMDDLCPCGSKLEFKNCCKKHHLISKRMMDDIENGIDQRKYFVSPYATLEKSVDSFFKTSNKLNEIS